VALLEVAKLAQRRKGGLCHPTGVAKCTVSYRDAGGVGHVVNVEAESLHEPAAITLNALRAVDLKDSRPNGESPLEVTVHRPAVVHRVRVKQVANWITGPSKGTRGFAARTIEGESREKRKRPVRIGTLREGTYFGGACICFGHKITTGLDVCGCGLAVCTRTGWRSRMRVPLMLSSSVMGRVSLQNTMVAETDNANTPRAIMRILLWLCATKP